MPVPGYDPDDLECLLERRLDDGDLEDLLTEAERRAHDEGTPLVDLLDGETLGDLVTRSEP